MELNVRNCSATNVQHFDTHHNPADAESMAAYINALPRETVLIAVTADDAQRHMTSSAYSALLKIGVNASGLQYRGKVAFVALIGQPSQTVSNVMPASGDNLQLNVTVRGRLCQQCCIRV